MFNEIHFNFSNFPNIETFKSINIIITYKKIKKFNSRYKPPKNIKVSKNKGYTLILNIIKNID